jgi:hypothetical protein
MKLACNLLTVVLSSSLIFMVPSLSHARYQFEFTPSISISELYDDNIDLEATDKKTDWITTVSPGITMNLFSEDNNNIVLRYIPTWVSYKKETHNNTVRHSATLTISENLTRSFRFDLTNNYLISEDPIETTLGITGIRQTRNVYQRNTGGASLNYLFGPENTLSIGYDHSLLENGDLTLDDNTASNPYAGLTWWLNQKNGIELNCRYTIAEYTRDDNSIPGDNYTGDNAGLTYLYRFGERTTFLIGDEYTAREFDGLTEDYSVHDWSAGFEHSFSNQTSLSISVGYFLLKNEYSDYDGGYSYDVSFIKNFSRGNFSIGGAGGWREGYQEASRRGFTKYYGMNSRFDYLFMERLNNYAGISYIQDEYAEGGISKDYRASYGWRLSFLRWFSVSLDYSYLKGSDGLDMESYTNNRIMMTLTASKPYR